MYYDTGTNVLYWWNGTAWTTSGGGGTPASTACARAYRNAALSPSTGFTKIPLDTVSYDTSGLVSTANGRINIPVTGYYDVTGSIDISVGAGSSDILVSIFVNGTERVRGDRATTPSAQYVCRGVADKLSLNAGDFVEMHAYSSALGYTLVDLGPSTNYLSLALLTSLPGAVGPTTSARAYRNAALTTGTASTWTKIAIDAISFDPGGNMSVASSRYVCPATGYYKAEANFNVISSVSGQQAYAGVMKNGTVVTQSGGGIAQAAGQAIGGVASDTIQCNAGDYLELAYYCTAAGLGITTGAPSTNWFSVVQVGNLSATPASTATAKLNRRAAWTTATGIQKVPFDTVVYDSSGMTQVANNRIVAPVAGYYQVNGQFETSSAYNARVILMVYKNGAEAIRGSDILPPTTFVGVTVSDVIYCNAGDYLELTVYAGVAMAADVTGIGTYLSAALLTPLSGTAGPVTPARAYRNAAFTVVNAWAKIVLDSVANDPGSNVSLASSRYVCPATGFYQVDGSVIGSGIASGQYAQCALYKNGALATYGNAGLGGGATCSTNVSDLIQCNAGDYLELWCAASAGTLTGIAGAVATFLSVVQVGNSMNFTAAGGDLAGTYPNPSVAPAYVTSLPGSPIDGQQVYYLADATNGVVWHLRYRAASASAYKWEYVGGPPLFKTIDTDEAFTASANFNNPTTVGPDVVPPLNGDFLYQMSAGLYIASQTTGGSMAIGLSIAGAAPVAVHQALQYAVTGSSASIAKNGLVTGMVAGNAFRIMYFSPTAMGGTPHARFRALQVTPVRVG
jgi:hypothetical protein